jgi:hypothetical protein
VFLSFLFQNQPLFHGWNANPILTVPRNLQTQLENDHLHIFTSSIYMHRSEQNAVFFFLKGETILFAVRYWARKWNEYELVWERILSASQQGSRKKNRNLD